MKTLHSILSAFCVRHHVMVANDAPADDIFAVNEAAYGVDDTGVMVVPFGEVPVMVSMNGRKVRGLQRIDAIAGNEMAADMTGIMGMLKNAFMGRPIFLGHPYHPDAVEAAKYPDKRARGFIKSVEVANDAIRLMPKYNKLGNEEVTDHQMIFHSPQWRMKPVMAANGQQEVKDGMPVFRPYSLHSGGLTNNPNIPVPPLMGANEEAQPGQDGQPGQEVKLDANKIREALTALGVIQPEDDETAILSAISGLASTLQWARDAKEREDRENILMQTALSAKAAIDPTTAREAMLQSLLQAVDAYSANEVANEAELETLSADVTAANERFTAARTAHIDTALKPLIAANKIPGAQIDAVRTELIAAANEADIDTRLAELAKTKPKLGTTGGVTDEVKPGAMNQVMAANDASARSKQRTEAVHECLAELTKGGAAKPGDQERAWNLARSRNPELFAH